MHETAILVLLYNKEICESQTPNSLINLDVHYVNAKVIIWNNGPKLLQNKCVNDFKLLGYDTHVEETLNNESLAVIYNKFLFQNVAEKYILLDDDSTLTKEYVTASSGCNPNVVAMPVITAFGKVRTPNINGLPYFYGMNITLGAKVITIGTGLVIGNGIVERLKIKYDRVFDERFYFYGVDTSFCLRLYKADLTNKIKFIHGFDHSLSRLEKETSKVKDFRRLERSYDLGLILRHYYPCKEAVLSILKVFVVAAKRMLFKQEGTVYLFHLCMAFLSGKHYRNKKD